MFYRLSRYYQASQLQYAAATLTFISLLALVPLLSLMRLLSHSFPPADYLTDGFVLFVNQLILPYGDSLIDGHLLEFKQHADRFTAGGLVVLTFISFMLAHTMEKIFHQVGQNEIKRPLLLRFVLSLCATFCGPLVIGLGTQIYQQLYQAIPHFAISLTAGTALLWLLYSLVPHKKAPQQWVLLSAFCTALLIGLAKWGFSLYLQNIDTYQALYGSFAFFPFFLLWLNLLWLLILNGLVLIRFFTE